MRRLLLVLLLLVLLLLPGMPAAAQTRLYFWHLVPPVTSTVDAGWDASNQVRYLTLYTGTRAGFTDHTASSGHIIDITEDSGDWEVAGQLISPVLATGTTFTSGVTTVAVQLPAAEWSSGDNVIGCDITLKVISEDGSTVRATLLSLANWGTTTELLNTFSPNGRNKTCANGDAVGATYETVSGDRLLLEVGYHTTGVDTTPQVYTQWAEGEDVADCPVDETTTTGCRGWIELSNTFSFATDAGANTRLYFPFDEAAAVSPGFLGAWEDTSSALRRRLSHTKGSSAIAAGSEISVPDDTANWQDLDRQYVSDPMAAGIAFTRGVTSVALQVATGEQGGADEFVFCVVGVRVVSQDGSTTRADLIPVRTDFTSGFAPALTYGTLRQGTLSEYSVYVAGTYTNRGCLQENLSYVEASYTTVSGDRLVVEVGHQNRDASDTINIASIEWGEDAPDCPVDNSTTTDCAGWIEFSNTLTFSAEGGSARNPIVISSLRAPDVQLTALELSDRACGSSRDTVVSVRAVRPTERAIEKALRRARAWAHRRDGRHCICIVMTPVLGSDGDHVVAPVLIIFRLDGAPPKLQQPWRRLDKTPPYGKVA